MKNSVKILFYDDEALGLMNDPLTRSGGAARQVLAWSKGLESIGVKTMIAGGHSNNDLGRIYRNARILYNPNRGIRKLRFFYIRLPRIFLSLKRIKPDFIYYGIPSNFAGILAIMAKISGIKFILRVSSDIFVDSRVNKNLNTVNYILFKIGFTLANIILCQNNYQYSCLIKKYPSKTCKLRNPYIGNIVENPLPVEERKCIAWVGNIRYPKNVPLLLEIVKALPQVHFKLAGSVLIHADKDSRYSFNLLKEMPNVRILGNINPEEVLSLLKEAYILLNTSHYEGFSNTYLEAFSVGTPVFAPAHNDPDNIIKSYQLGYGYKGITDLVEEFNALVINNEKFTRLSSNCLQYMRDNHDLIYQSNKFLKIISDNKESD